MTDFKYTQNFYETDKVYFDSLEKKDKYWFKDYINKIMEYSFDNSKILEVGCGTGVSTSIIAEKRKKTTGVDFSKTFVDATKKKGCKARVMSATDIKFKDESFDLVCCADLLEHIPQIEKALDEMTRVVKKEGHLVIQSPNLWSNLFSYNYRKNPISMIKKVMRGIGDVFSAKKKTIEKYKLDVLEGDKDAYTLLSGVWLKKELKKRGLKIKYFTSYSMFFKVNKIYKLMISIMEKLPFVKNLGGRMIVVAEKIL